MPASIPSKKMRIKRELITAAITCVTTDASMAKFVIDLAAKFDVKVEITDLNDLLVDEITDAFNQRLANCETENLDAVASDNYTDLLRSIFEKVTLKAIMRAKGYDI